MKLIDNIGLSHLIGKLKALIELKADKTYVDNKVKTDVPTGAKFTDTNTVTSINGKTGTILKADIVALGIPAQDTVVDISGKADKTELFKITIGLTQPTSGWWYKEII